MLVKKKVIVFFLFLLAFSCKADKIVEVKDIESHWSDYIKVKILDNTNETDDKVKPSIVIEFQKVTNNKLFSVECKFNYDYGYKYFSKEEIIILDENNSDLNILNSGKVLRKEFNYKFVKKIKVPDGQEFNIILHGIKSQAKITKLSYCK